MTTTTAHPMSGKEPSEQQPTREQVRRGRRTALLLFAIGFGPMIFATIMFYTGWLNPAGHSNNGVLIQPPVPVSQLHLQDANGQPLTDRFGPKPEGADWMLMVVAGECDADCETLLYLARQVNIALGKNANRVDRAAYLGSMSGDLAGRWQKDYGSMERLQKLDNRQPVWPQGISPGQQPRILLVDPLGNVMMHYGTEHTGNDLLKDLKHLLKLSQIG